MYLAAIMEIRWTVIYVAFILYGGVRSDPYHLHDMYGTFESPNFPHFYENNLNLTWSIKVSKGLHVVLYFKVFDLEDSYVDGTACATDYLEIFDGAPESAQNSSRFCGNYQLYPDDAPEPYEELHSTTNILSIRFVSDYSNDLPGSPPPKGFQAIYKAEDIDECEDLEEKYETALYPEQVGRCDHHCNNYMGGYSCTCDPGYQLSSDGYTCQGKCSNIFVSSRAGAITSPGYPHNYPKSTDCDWTIQVDVGQLIQIDFIDAFAIEDYLTEGQCPYDWLKIIDGDVEKTYCGTTLPDTWVSTGSLVRIEFHTDMVKEMKGFHITHRVQGVYCDEPNPPAHGRVLEAYGAENGRLPYESVVVFECERGYIMQGEHKITCLKDGSFDDDVPICKREP